MNLDRNTATGFTPYELSPSNTLLTMSCGQRSASLHRQLLVMASCWLAMTAGGMGAIAAFAAPALGFPLAVGATGLLRRWVSTCSTRPNTASRNASCSAETRALLASSRRTKHVAAIELSQLPRANDGVRVTSTS